MNISRKNRLEFDENAKVVPNKISYKTMGVFLSVIFILCLFIIMFTKIEVKTYVLEEDPQYQNIAFQKIPLTITDTSNEEKIIIKRMMNAYTSSFSGEKAFMMEIKKIEYKEIDILKKKPFLIAKVKFVLQPSLAVQEGNVDFLWGKIAEDNMCYGQCFIEISKKDNEYSLVNIGKEPINDLQ